MPFVRSKVVKDQVYYQLVEGFRDPETRKVRHRTLASLGRQPSVAKALAAAKRMEKRLARQLAKAEPAAGRSRAEALTAARLTRQIATVRARVSLLKSVSDVVPTRCRSSVARSPA